MLTITHDFKAPLIQLSAILISFPVRTGQRTNKEYLENMKSSSDHLLKLVTDLLDFHRLDLNKTEITGKPLIRHNYLDDIKFSFEPLPGIKDYLLNMKWTLYCITFI